MAKVYILDTNVLIQAPDAFLRFEENLVILPMAVLEKLDKLKRAEGETGANARKAIRLLEQLRLKGDLLAGVPLEGGGTLRVEKNFIHIELPQDLPRNPTDDRILKVCKGYMQTQDRLVVLVTKDLVLRMKAQMMGIRAEDFAAEQASDWEQPYLGRIEVYVPESDFKDFKKKGIPLDLAYTVNDQGTPQKTSLTENEFVIVKADQSNKKTILGRVENDRILPLKYKKVKPYGITPRNVGQYFLQEALMQPASKAPLVIVKGMAGTAKTFYSLAVGLEKLLNNPTGEYRRILVSRPYAQFDTDIGFLPGDEQEKISPLMRPVIDNLEQLIDSNEEKRYEDERALSGKMKKSSTEN